MKQLTNEQIQAILDREYKGLDASGLGFTALDIVDDLARELLELRASNKNKLYSFDQGWAGMIVTVASNKEDAEKAIKGNYVCRSWGEKSTAEEHEIKEGLTISSLGDQ